METKGWGPRVPILDRRRRIREALAARNADTLISDSFADIHYFTGCHDADGFLVLTAGEDAWFLTSAHDAPQARAEAQATDIVVWGPGEDPLDQLLPEVQRRGRHVITPGIAGAVLDRLRRTSGAAEIEVVPGFTAGQRRVKEQGELELIRQAARIVEAGMAAAREALRPGVRESEIATAAEQATRALGSSGRVFDTKVESGPRSAWPSSYASERVIQAGDLVLIDIGPTYRGYYGDLTRTFVVGEPTLEQYALLELTLNAQRAALDAIRPGVSGHDVDEAARRVMRAAGHGDRFLHHTGHALGLAGDSLMLIAPNAHDALLTGECITVEPGVYLEQRGGVRIEDEVCVTDDGIEMLTSFDSALESLVVAV